MSSSRWENLRAFLLRPKSARPLDLIQRGLALLVILGSPREWAVAVAFASDRFHYSLLPNFLIPPSSVVYGLVLARVLLGIFILMGWAVPVCFGILGALWMYGLFVSPLYYHNNSYLLGLLCLWMSFCGSPRKSSSKTVPYGSYLILLIQASAIYFFSALAKLTDPEWRSGQVLFAYAQDHVFPFLSIWLSPRATSVIAPTIIVSEFLLSIALWIPSWRRWAILLGVLFHLGLEAVADVGYFSWEIILLYIGIAGPDDPALLQWLWWIAWIGIALLGLRSFFPILTITRYAVIALAGIAAVRL